MGNSLLLSKIFSFVLLFCVVVVNLNAQVQQYETITVDGKSYYKYKVQPGEGLYAISRTFSVTVADIIRSNPSSNHGLQNGQDLLIPISGNPNVIIQSPTPTLSPSPSLSPSYNSVAAQSNPSDQNINFNHTVVSGETVYSISNMYNTTVDDIYKLNPGAREGIRVGEVLIIPQRRIISEVKEENYRYHTILPKETLYSVSKTYSLKPEDIMMANPGLSVQTFQIGKTIGCS